MKDFHELKVWQKAHQLTDHGFVSTRRIVRADESDPAVVFINPGECGGRMRTQRGCRVGRFCSIAMGSASELEYHLLLARDLKPMDYEELVRRAIELKRMLTVLMQKLKADR